MNKIIIVIPVFNEEGNIGIITEKLRNVFKSLPEIAHEVLFVDDGSTDRSLSIIMKLSHEYHNVFYLSLSKNFGKDIALMAGLEYSKADAVLTMDADLQHPAELIPELINWWQNGYDVVYTYRKNKNIYAGFFSGLRSKLFYYAVNSLSDVELENGISDFKLLDRKVVNAIINLPENKPFLRGIIKWVGFKQKAISYDPKERYSGFTKYNFSTLMNLATHGLTSFSTKPLSFAIYLGFFFSAISLLYIPYVLLSFYYHWDRGPGWASVIVTIAFFGGIQLMIMGIVGIYLGKTFMQSKGRPRYIIESSNIEEMSN